MVHAGDVMVRPVVSVRCSTPLREAGTVLAEYGYAGLPVVDESGCLLGFLTTGDVLRAAPGREATAMTAMTSPAVSVALHSDLDDIGRVLVRRGIRSVPVVDDERRVIGIISRGDLLRLDLTSDDVIAVGAQKMLDGYTGKRRWIAQARQGEVLVAGHFDSDAERRIATALVRTVPGVREVRIGAATPSTD
ncbi:CBS domain-containing protein [Mycolicibacterium iranicum]|uniref:Histidine kinase n=1 Tax=Mycolicibacterium iranicum TaxID=912594 RepID=A0A178LUL7_MYCIR|nr:CBS domain-containing protein [Mycolicibacterium iranicum]OAN37884.1 histidine kinase [Mycolicibacterium iranicum]